MIASMRSTNAALTPRTSQIIDDFVLGHVTGFSPVVSVCFSMCALVNIVTVSETNAET